MSRTITVRAFVEPDARASHLAEAFTAELARHDVIVESTGHERHWIVFNLRGAAHHDLGAIARETAGALHPRLEIECHQRMPY